MTAYTIPPCPHCGSAFRRSGADDGLLCKCGLEITGVMAHQRKCLGQPLTVADGTFRPIPQSTAGIRVGRKFSELIDGAWFADATPLPKLPDLAAHAIAYGAKLGLRHQSQESLGQRLVVPRPNGDRIQLEHDPVYGLCRPHEVLECVERMVDLIAEGGPGDWWSLAGAVHAIADDGVVHWDAFGGEPHLRLRSLGAVDRDVVAGRLPPEPSPYLDLIELRKQWAALAPAMPTALDRVRLIDKMLDQMVRPRVFVRDANVEIKQVGTMTALYSGGPPPEPVSPSVETPWMREYQGEWKCDPLDVKYDDVQLRTLLDRDRLLRTDHPGKPKTGDWKLTPLQRSAVSAHWSAELRAKVVASKERERNAVTYCEVDADE